MEKKLHSRVSMFLGVLCVGLLLPSCKKDPVSERAQFCAAKEYARSCLYFARYENVREYERPSTSSRHVSNRQWARPIGIDWARVNEAPPGWLPAKQSGGWIELSGAARADEFKRVTGCWPIASMQHTTGNVTTTMKFSADGVVAMLVDNRASESKETYHSHISFTPNLVLMREGGLAIYGYDSKTRKFGDKNVKRVTYLPPNQLKGCEAGLKLES